MKKLKKFILLLMTLSLVVMMAAPNISIAEEPPVPVPLGTTSTFAILAYSAITNTGSTTIVGDAGGDIGLSPTTGTAITGFPPGTVTGTIYAVDDSGPDGSVGDPARLTTARADLLSAYEDARDRGGAQDLSGQNLGERTLGPGVYSFSSDALLAGTLVLDAGGDPDAVFIFQIYSALTTATGSVVRLKGDAQYCRIFWQVGSSATLETDSVFVGHIFADASITAKTGAQVQGQLLALNGAVTLDNNIITNGICETTQPVLPTPEEPALPTPEEPVVLASAASLPKTGGYAVEALFGLGVLLAGAGIVLKKKSW